MDQYEEFKDEQCPVCGYCCLGKGGMGCIDKPVLCGLSGNQETETKDLEPKTKSRQSVAGT
jgi:hypothetical protein